MRWCWLSVSYSLALAHQCSKLGPRFCSDHFGRAHLHISVGSHVGANSSRGHTFWIVLTATGEVEGKVNYALAVVLRESVNLLSPVLLSMHLTLKYNIFQF